MLDLLAAMCNRDLHFMKMNNIATNVARATVLLMYVGSVSACAVEADSDGARENEATTAAAQSILLDSAIDPSTGERIDVAALTIVCPADYICWYDSGASGGWGEAAHESLPYLRCYNLGPAINNRTSYIVNNTDAGWRVYNPTGCGGSYGYIYPHSSGFMNSTWNNNISSYMREPIP